MKIKLFTVLMYSSLFSFLLIPLEFRFTQTIGIGIILGIFAEILNDLRKTKQ